MIFLGELAASVVHMVIATAVGVLLDILPHRAAELAGGDDPDQADAAWAALA